nr:adenylosuccinate synthetase-like [Nerophis lumbriciformis]
MANTVVLGMQWGDEGKGKIVDLIGPAFDAVARYQGGDNAGHTVKFGDRHFSLHLIPSGILHPAQRCVLGNGMVISPDAFFAEVEGLTAAGVEVDGRLFVAERAHVILPHHAALDRAREAARGDAKIGTTARGIGPAYEMKAARCGLRIGELAGAALETRLQAQLDRALPELERLGGDSVPSLAELIEQSRDWAERLRPYVCDGARSLNRWIAEGSGILFEGAQGALLDLDQGTYPYVTSSSTIAGGVCTGAGVPPGRISGAIGVIKAYTTRVGEGPFTSELDDAVGEHLRARGHEFGTTTGRPRRCGWFDAVAARHAQLLNGIDVMALTKLDVLDELDELKICTAYRYRGEELRDFPADISVLAAAEPVYISVPGWRQETAGTLDTADLPAAASDYIQRLEDLVEVPVGLISTGPRREETLLRPIAELDHLLGGQLDRILEHRDSKS